MLQVSHFRHVLSSEEYTRHHECFSPSKRCCIAYVPCNQLGSCTQVGIGESAGVAICQIAGKPRSAAHCAGASARRRSMRLHVFFHDSFCSLGHERCRSWHKTRTEWRLVATQRRKKTPGFAARGSRQGQPCAHSNRHRLRAAARRKVCRPLLRNPCQSSSPPAPRFGLDGVSFRQVERSSFLCFVASSC
jgi:hypothetical protein